jgi:hypothetical protein
LDTTQPRAQELTAQTLFRLAQPVSLPTGHTVMAPLVDRPVPVERVVVYRATGDGGAEAAGGRHPLAAVRLRNAGEASLPAGLATLYERLPDGGLTYLGDALLPQMAPAAEELLGYGLDANVEVGRREAGASRVERARIVDGVLELSRVEQRRDSYAVTAARFAGPARRFVLEQPLPPGWSVAEPADAAVVDGATVRVERNLAPASDQEILVVTEHPEAERIELLDVDAERLGVMVEGAPLSPELRGAIQRLQALSAQVADVERRIEAVETGRAERLAEQERLRANLQAVPADSDLARRFVDRLGATEDELGGLARQLDGLRAERDRVQQERRDYIRSLRV